jgi:hypothetical protein
MLGVLALDAGTVTSITVNAASAALMQNQADIWAAGNHR